MKRPEREVESEVCLVTGSPSRLRYQLGCRCKHCRFENERMSPVQSGLDWSTLHYRSPLAPPLVEATELGHYHPAKRWEMRGD